MISRIERTKTNISIFRAKLLKAAPYQRRFDIVENSLVDYGIAQRVEPDSLAVRIGKEAIKSGSILLGFGSCAIPYIYGMTEIAKRIENPNLLSLISISAFIPVLYIGMAAGTIAKKLVQPGEKFIRLKDY